MAAATKPYMIMNEVLNFLNRERNRKNYELYGWKGRLHVLP